MKPLYVSQTFLPPIEDYNKYLKKLWKTHILTGNEPELGSLLERKLEKYWGVKHVITVANGTTALQIGLKALDVKEIQTSPFGFVATVAAASWVGVKLNFVDSGTENSSKPSLFTHIYGIPNRVKGKPIMYDASHAFTTKVKGKSVLTWGNLSAISFSAVKIFQCGEGGAVVTNSDKLAKKVRMMKNYGLASRYEIGSIGTNGKMSELHAAMGLSVLPYVPMIREKLNKITEKYNNAFDQEYGDYLTYYPIKFSSGERLLEAVKEFENNNIFPRRYFYPPLNSFYLGKRCVWDESESKKTLAIPFHYYLTDKDIKRVVEIANKYL